MSFVELFKSLTIPFSDCNTVRDEGVVGRTDKVELDRSALLHLLCNLKRH